MYAGARAVVVGSGPNGLSAAYILAQAGLQVTVFEASETLGGGLRSFYNDRFGTVHDHCAAVHPLARLSPWFRQLGLAHKVAFVTPPRAYMQAMHGDHHVFRRASAAFSGVAAHTALPPAAPLAIAAGVVLGTAGILTGWPIPVGGTGQIAQFLLNHLEHFDITWHVATEVYPNRLPQEINNADLVLWDTDIAVAYQAAGIHNIQRVYGPGAAKADFVTTAPIPWSNRRLSHAGTVHLGGTWGSVSRAERAVNDGQLPQHAFVLVSQPTLFDPSRAPTGLHTVWAYAHVPAGSFVDPVQVITAEITRYAPGFAETIVDARGTTAAAMQTYNPNAIGGDIASGAMRGMQLFTSGSTDGMRFREIMALPWRLPKTGWYLCSGATLPGPGVHGISGVCAATMALRELS